MLWTVLLGIIIKYEFIFCKPQSCQIYILYIINFVPKLKATANQKMYKMFAKLVLKDIRLFCFNLFYFPF